VGSDESVEAKHMPNRFTEMSDQETWPILVNAAKRGLEAQGFKLTRVPGRGRSNIWEIEQQGKAQRASIRTTKGRWFAFPTLKHGKAWKTLDDVEKIVVAAVDDKDDPRKVQVYLFQAPEVRNRFNAAYAARTKAGLVVKDNFGMWINLDDDKRRLPTSVGAGLAADHQPIAEYSLDELLAEGAPNTGLHKDESDPVESEQSESPPRTIAEVMNWARRQIADLSGFPVQAVKLDLKIEH
jgi:hypothetical protein